MKKVMSFAAMVFFVLAGVSLAATEKDTITEREKATWQSFQDKKADVFRKFLAADYRGVYSDGMKLSIKRSPR
jgi:hypothetical protein